MVGPIFASALSYNVYLHFRYLLPLFLIQDGIRCSRMKDERTDVLSFSIELKAMVVFYICILQKTDRFCYAFRQDVENNLSGEVPWR